MDKNKKLDFLIRKNEGRNLLKELKKSNFFKNNLKNIEFFPLDISDNIREKFLEEFKKNLYKVIYIQNIDEISDIIISNNKSFDIYEEIYLFFSISNKIGCMNVSFKFFLEEILNFINLDSESIYVFNLDKNKFIYIDKYVDDFKKEKFSYEILIN